MFANTIRPTNVRASVGSSWSGSSASPTVSSPPFFAVLPFPTVPPAFWSAWTPSPPSSDPPQPASASTIAVANSATPPVVVIRRISSSPVVAFAVKLRLPSLDPI